MSATLDAALARIARKADIMRMDATRHSTARQDAEEIMALVAIAQRKVAGLETKLAKAKEFSKLADDNLTNLQPKIANGLVHKDWIPVFDGYIDPVIVAARATLAELKGRTDGQVDTD